MKLRVIFSACLFAFSSITYANHLAPKCNHFAIQGAISTGGNLGIGLANYTETTEIGLILSANKNNARTGFVVPAAFAGFRHALGQYTYFAYGIDLASKFGEEDGKHIDSDIQAGPYISLEQALTTHFLLVGWIEPYSIEYEKKNGSSLTTQKLFGSGGLGISYLF